MSAKTSVKTYDAIVVGSGITGGWAAKELTEKGLATLVLEAGSGSVPCRDCSPTWRQRRRSHRRRPRDPVHRSFRRSTTGYR